MYKSFIDTNIWVYALIEAEEEKEKKLKVTSFLENLKNQSTILTSVQVLNEFHWVLKRKYKIDESIIRDKVSNGILKITQVVPVNLQSYMNAYDIRNDYDISFWDSIIAASALENGCEYLYSEDMQHELLIDNKLTILNPLI